MAEKALSLKTVKEHFDSWRSKRIGKSHIPQQLWKEAVDLVENYSVSKVSKTLGLHPSCLRGNRLFFHSMS